MRLGRGVVIGRVVQHRVVAAVVDLSVIVAVTLRVAVTGNGRLALHARSLRLSPDLRLHLSLSRYRDRSLSLRLGLGLGSLCLFLDVLG